MPEKEELIRKISDGVLEKKKADTLEASERYVEQGYPVIDAIMEGLIDGMKWANQKYEEGEYYVADVMFCSNVMTSALDYFKEHMPEDHSGEKKKVVIGVTEGDTHDIGKNLVKIMLESEGYAMVDLGKDVPAKEFIDAVEREQPDLLCLSSFMTTSINVMEKIIGGIEERGLRDSVKIIIGGGVATGDYAKKIGADGYSGSAVEAVELVKRLIGK